MDEVRVLENLIDHAHDKRDQVAAGFFIAQLHSRARFSSLQFSSAVIKDFSEDQGGYLEFSCLFNKTSVTKEAKATFMPHVAPAVGVLGTPWASAWIKLLMEENLIEAENEFSDNVFKFVKGCILPEVQKDGSWGVSPLGNSDATKWLNGLLSMGGSQIQSESPATHSLKSTPLSWAAKFGIGISDRELLGHHSLGRHMSALTYSRDAQARPLRLYQEILRSIAAGTFDPDSTRSGRFITKRQKCSSPTAKNPEPKIDSWLFARSSEDSFVMLGTPEKEDASDITGIDTPKSDRTPAKEAYAEDISSEEDRSSSSSSSSDESLPEFQGSRRELKGILDSISKLDEDTSVFVHKLSDVIHFRKEKLSSTLKCSRKLSANYHRERRPVVESHFKHKVLCSHCFGK